MFLQTSECIQLGKEAEDIESSLKQTQTDSETDKATYRMYTESHQSNYRRHTALSAGRLLKVINILYR